MEDIKEKLLCALRSNIKGLSYDSMSHPFYLKTKSGSIYIKYKNYYKEIITYYKKHWWSLKKSKDISRTVDYRTLEIIYGTIKIELSREESEELLKFREEKILENQLLELDKLCNTKI